jgi:hypothetical protein
MLWKAELQGSRLASGSAQGKGRLPHLHLRLKQQLLRSQNGNGNCSYRDSDVEYPVTLVRRGLCYSMH